MKAPKKYTPEEALQYAAGACARAEQSEFDIRRKLRLHGITGAEADKIIDYLFEHSFLDDERFAKAFANDKVQFSSWGKIKIRAALAMKKIPRYAIDKALEAIEDDDYLFSLNTLALQLSKNVDLRDRESRLKIVRRLASRGYELSLINQAIANVIEFT